MAGTATAGYAHAVTGEGQDSGEQVAVGMEHEDGDMACLAHLVCPDCGNVISEGHRPGCSNDAARDGSSASP